MGFENRARDVRLCAYRSAGFSRPIACVALELCVCARVRGGTNSMNLGREGVALANRKNLARGAAAGDMRLR
jgi:hypothetical protein